METLLDEEELLDLVKYSLETIFTLIDNNEVLSSAAQKEREKQSYQKKDKKCKSSIIKRIADSHLEYVKDAKTSFQMWNSLKDTFARTGIASQLFLRKNLLSLKFDHAVSTLTAHFLQFDKLVRELKSTGANMENSDVVCHLLLTMPAEYEIVVTALETLPAEQLTVTFVKNRLLDEETKRRGSNDDSLSQAPAAFAATSRRRGGKFVPGKKVIDKKNYKCHRCGQYGHFRHECPKNSDGQNSSGGSNNRGGNNRANFAANDTEDDEEVLLLRRSLLSLHPVAATQSPGTWTQEHRSTW